MPVMLTLTVQLALFTAVLPSASSASGTALNPGPAHVRVVAQGWVGQPRTTPPPPPPPAPVIAQPRTTYPVQAPPPPVVERFGPRRGWVWITGNYEWRGGRYMWVGGHWERERAGFRWEAGRWDWQANHYVWIPGSWLSRAPP